MRTLYRDAPDFHFVIAPVIAVLTGPSCKALVAPLTKANEKDLVIVTVPPDPVLVMAKLHLLVIVLGKR
jgi:hypothetical protein